MMNSGISTKHTPSPGAARADADRDSGFHAWHFYMLLAMIGATVSVVVSRNTQPLALVLLSAAALAAGLVGFALHRALTGFFSTDSDDPALIDDRLREALQREKALVLRSIKELEFDRAMGKVSEADFANIGGRLRARALTLMQDLERAPVPAMAPPREVAEPAARAMDCPGCGTANETDARFCKHCGRRLDV